MKSPIRLLGCACFLAAAHPAISAEAPDPAFRTLRGQISALKNVDLPENFRSEVLVLWKSMAANATELESLAGKYQPSPKYLKNIEQNAEALRLVTSSDLPGQNKVELCRAVDKDLKAKTRASSANKSANPLTDIEVVAETLSGTKIVPGCEVWFVPEAWKNEVNRHARFPQLSSPTKIGLPPGYYSFWSLRDGKKGAVIPVTIEATRPIHVPAP